MKRFVAIALSAALVLLEAAPLLAAPPAPKAPARAARAVEETGSISGTARSNEGVALPNYGVQVRDLQTGKLVAATTSNTAGSFFFGGLSAGNYVIEIVNPAGMIIGCSAAIPIAAGANVIVTVSAAAAALIAGSTAGGISTALIVTTAAAAAGITGIVIAVKRNASPSQ